MSKRHGIVLGACLALVARPATSALPNWAGLWETEGAARLSATGVFTPPALWEKKARNEMTSKAPASAAQPSDLPPTAKACLPAGFPAVMDYPVPDALFEMLVTAAQTLLVSTDGTIRHIYTDGRKHPQEDDLWATPEGHSIGHWEGATLVVETIARAEGGVSPMPDGIVLSGKAVFIEKLRRVDRETLQNEMTIEDPQRLPLPWHLLIRYKLVKDVDRMIAVNCSENDRNPVVDGKTIITPP